MSDLLKRDCVKQAKYFDQHAKQLSELNPGDIVRMKLPGETQWSQAVVSSKIDLAAIGSKLMVKSTGETANSCVRQRKSYKNLRSTSTKARV